MPRLLIQNPTSLGKNTTEEKPRQNIFSYSYLGILFAAAKNAEIRELKNEYFSQPIYHLKMKLFLQNNLTLVNFIFLLFSNI